MARQLARRVCKTWPNAQDELQSTACLALVEAARGFDPSRGIGFGAYPPHRIRGAASRSGTPVFSRRSTQKRTAAVIARGVRFRRAQRGRDRHRAEAAHLCAGQGGKGGRAVAQPPAQGSCRRLPAHLRPRQVARRGGGRGRLLEVVSLPPAPRSRPQPDRGRWAEEPRGVVVECRFLAVRLPSGFSKGQNDLRHVERREGQRGANRCHIGLEGYADDATPRPGRRPAKLSLSS